MPTDFSWDEIEVGLGKKVETKLRKPAVGSIIVYRNVGQLWQLGVVSSHAKNPATGKEYMNVHGLGRDHVETVGYDEWHPIETTPHITSCELECNWLQVFKGSGQPFADAVLFCEQFEGLEFRTQTDEKGMSGIYLRREDIEAGVHEDLWAAFALANGGLD